MALRLLAVVLGSGGYGPSIYPLPTCDGGTVALQSSSTKLYCGPLSTGGATGAPQDAGYIVFQADPGLSGGRVLSSGTNTTVDIGTAGQVKVNLSGTVTAGAVSCSGCVADGALASSYSGVGGCGTSTWAHSLNANNAPSCTQPAYSDITEPISLTQVAKFAVMDAGVSVVGGNEFIGGILFAQGIDAGALIAQSAALGGITSASVLDAGALSVGGPAVVGGALSVAGVSSLQVVDAGALSVGGAAVLGGTLSVAGVSSLQVVDAGTLSVAGNSTIAGLERVNVLDAGVIITGGNEFIGGVLFAKGIDAGALIAQGAALGGITSVSVLDAGTISVGGKATLPGNSATCTLNAASPSTCTVNITSNALCYCVNVGTTAASAAAGCAVSPDAGVLIITSANGASNVVNAWCNK